MEKPKKTPDHRKLLPVREVLRRVPWSRTTLHRKVKEKVFPKPVRFSAYRVGWWEHEVDEYLERIAEAAA